MLKKWDDKKYSKENINERIDELNNEISSMKENINKIIQYLHHQKICLFLHLWRLTRPYKDVYTDCYF